MASARLISRDEDVAILRDAVVTARAAEARCVLVTGEAGIGKTRLVAEALAEVGDALVVTGHGVDMATGEIPFGVLADTLRDLLHRGGQGGLTAHERDALAPLLPGSAAGPAGIDRVRLLSAFVEVLERLSAERLLVWVVEDLHWADSATRDVVNLRPPCSCRPRRRASTCRTSSPSSVPPTGPRRQRWPAGRGCFSSRRRTRSPPSPRPRAPPRC